MAAPQVVAHRTARMAQAGPTPTTAHRQALTRMTQEKFEAFGESASAGGPHAEAVCTPTLSRYGEGNPKMRRRRVSWDAPGVRTRGPSRDFM